MTIQNMFFVAINTNNKGVNGPVCRQSVYCFHPSSLDSFVSFQFGRQNVVLFSKFFNLTKLQLHLYKLIEAKTSDFSSVLFIVRHYFSQTTWKFLVLTTDVQMRERRVIVLVWAIRIAHSWACISIWMKANLSITTFKFYFRVYYN